MPRKPKEVVTSGTYAERVPLDVHLMAGFAETFLQDDYDNPKPSPDFHRTLWDLFCSDAPFVVIAAPRGHAKSTAGTFAFGLACALFGTDDFILIVSATESLAAAHLANMARVIEMNEDLRTEFNLSIVRSNETELVCRVGGREFCVIGKGAEQKVRGILWRNKRPSLILVDDLEEDEAVMSKDRRDKLRNWFWNALIPCGSDRLRVRFVGTVLHLDSLLENLMEHPQWVSRRFRAHRSWDNFTDILWPEQFPEARLRAIRDNYRDNPSGYSQEYLSSPIAEADAYFKKAYFSPMLDADYRSPKSFYGVIEFAIGRDAKADNTALIIGGVDPDGLLHIVDVCAERMDPLTASEKMMEYQKQYDIISWVVEGENISKAIGPFLDVKMIEENVPMDIIMMKPVKDKEQRATAIRARMKAHGVRFDFNAEWFFKLQAEMMDFPRGKKDDQVDAMAWLGLFLNKLVPSRTPEELAEIAWRAEMYAEAAIADEGRSLVTGY